MRTRVGVVIVVLLIGLAACGGSENDTTTAEAPDSQASVTAPSSRQEEAWDRYKQQQSGEIELESTSDGDGKGARRVLARTDSDRRIVDVAEFDGRDWNTVGEVELPPPGFEFAKGVKRTIEFGDVTQDGRTDYLVPLDAAQDIGVVISDAGGAWRTLPVRGSDGVAREPYLGIEPRYENGELLSDERLCEPTCAEGGERVLTWHYENGELVNSSA